MNLETMERAWQKQIVIASKEPVESVAARMKHEVTVAQRRIRGGIVLAAFVLFTGWAVTLVTHITRIKPLTPVTVTGEIVSFILFLAFFIRAFHSARIVQREAEMLGGTLHESVGAVLRTIELQIENARIAGCAIPVVVGLSSWMFAVKYLSGEFPGFGVVVGTASTALSGAVIGAIVWRRHRTHLVPHREELRELLQTLKEENGPTVVS